MITEYIKIQDWNLKLIIVNNLYDINSIIEDLYELGCSYKNIIKVYKNITIGKYNLGFTCCNYDTRKAIIFIGKCTSSSEFINTLVHESRHLQQYIANYRNLNQNSEEVCYLLGLIVLKIYNRIKKYL